MLNVKVEYHFYIQHLYFTFISFKVPDHTHAHPTGDIFLPGLWLAKVLSVGHVF